MRRKILWIILVIVSAIIVFGIVNWNNGVRFVVNNSESAINNINVVYDDGTKIVDQLKPQKSYCTNINPKGESDIMLKWSGSNGVEYEQGIGVYIEHNYGGKITVKINSDGTLSTASQIGIRDLLWWSM